MVCVYLGVCMVGRIERERLSDILNDYNVDNAVIHTHIFLYVHSHIYIYIYIYFFFFFLRNIWPLASNSTLTRTTDSLVIG